MIPVPLTLPLVPVGAFVLAQSLTDQMDQIENLVIGSTGLVAVAVPAILIMWKALNAAQHRHLEELQRTIDRQQRDLDLCRPSTPMYGGYPPSPPPPPPKETP